MDNASITPDQIAYKKRVGRIGHAPVIELATTGGLHLIVVARGGKGEVLGTGPHRAVARFIAKKREDKIEWTSLEKSDHVPIECFQSVLDKYEALTEEIRSRQGQ
jgi:hypothetical protein